MGEKKKKERKRTRERREEIRWDKLDNTAHLFPVIAGPGMSNVYRLCAVLTENIEREPLQQALDWLLPQFPVFHVRIRQGMFWYYFEENRNPAPRVEKEADWPCQYIEAARNRQYLFRVTYYENRINLEVFHALTDGMGGFAFLRELVYQYLRLTRAELSGLPQKLSPETSLDNTDSYVKNYRHSASKSYRREHAFHLDGPEFERGKMGVVHGFMPASAVKERAKSCGASMNEYLAAALIWSIYRNDPEASGSGQMRPIAAAVPVNLRPYYDSQTTKNFFVLVTAVFHPVNGSHTFSDVLGEVKESLREQITREHLDDILSYNVSNEKNLFLRMVPMWIKKPVMRQAYRISAKANSTTLSNVGRITVQPEYEPFVERFYCYLSRSLGQDLKGCICTYGDTLTFTVTSVLAQDAVQRTLFEFLRREGIPVSTESNGVYGVSADSAGGVEPRCDQPEDGMEQLEGGGKQSEYSGKQPESGGIREEEAVRQAEDIRGRGEKEEAEEERQTEAGEEKTDRPLCGGYPELAHRRGGIGLARQIYIFSAAVVFFLLLFINRRVEAGLHWELIAGAGMLYAYMTWEVSFLRHGGYLRKALIQVFAGILFVIGLDLLLGFPGWSLDFVLPGALVLFDIAIVILMIVNSRNWQSYLPMQILLLACSLVPLALFRVHLVHVRLIALLGFLAVLAIFLGTLIIGGKRSRQELKRRFYI